MAAPSLLSFISTPLTISLLAKGSSFRRMPARREFGHRAWCFLFPKPTAPALYFCCFALAAVSELFEFARACTVMAVPVWSTQPLDFLRLNRMWRHLPHYATRPPRHWRHCSSHPAQHFSAGGVASFTPKPRENPKKDP